MNFDIPNFLYHQTRCFLIISHAAFLTLFFQSQRTLYIYPWLLTTHSKLYTSTRVERKVHKELKGFLSSLIYLEIDFRTIEEPESQCLKITKNLIFEKSKLAVKVYILCVIYFHVKINDFKSCDFLVKILELQKSKQMLRIPEKKSTILLLKILEVENAKIKKYKWDIVDDFQTMCVCPVDFI